MAKMKVHELAKELDRQSKELIAFLQEKGIDAKVAQSSIEEEAIELVRKHFKKDRQKGMEAAKGSTEAVKGNVETAKESAENIKRNTETVKKDTEAVKESAEPSKEGTAASPEAQMKREKMQKTDMKEEKPMAKEGENANEAPKKKKKIIFVSNPHNSKMAGPKQRPAGEKKPQPANNQRQGGGFNRQNKVEKPAPYRPVKPLTPPSPTPPVTMIPSNNNMPKRDSRPKTENKKLDAAAEISALSQEKTVVSPAANQETVQAKKPENTRPERPERTERQDRPETGLIEATGRSGKRGMTGQTGRITGKEAVKTREGQMAGLRIEMKIEAIIEMMGVEWKAKIAGLLKAVKVTGVILLAARLIIGLGQITTALTEEMEGRTIDSESLRPLKDSSRRARQRIRRSIGMKKSAELTRKGINALRRI